MTAGVVRSAYGAGAAPTACHPNGIEWLGVTTVSLIQRVPSLLLERAPHPMASRFIFKGVVLQPTSACNLNCSYCYVPGRNKDNRMPVSVTEGIAHMIEELPVCAPLEILWHCGEPLACGPEYFAKLMAPFSELENAGRVTHSVQTNATLIDKRWIDLFRAHPSLSVGVSIDGPSWANLARVDWKGAESYEKTIRGITRLQAANIPFDVLAVVTDQLLDQASVLYDFFAGLGCRTLGLNVEERSGINDQREIVGGSRVRKFWRELALAWRASPLINIRELGVFAAYWDEHPTKDLDERTRNEIPLRTILYPTIGWNGDVVFLSPEFLQNKSEKYHDFVVGNVNEEPLLRIIGRAKKAPYVLDYLDGTDACRATCRYFGFCGGGQAHVKYYEHGTTNVTETKSCKNARQHLFDALDSETRNIAASAGLGVESVSGVKEWLRPARTTTLAGVGAALAAESAHQ